MSLSKRIAFFTADATPETVYTNVSGTVTRIESVTLAQPSTAAATIIRLTIGVDGATTRWFEYSLSIGAQFVTVYPGVVLTGTETIQASSTVTDDVVVCTINASQDLVA